MTLEQAVTDLTQAISELGTVIESAITLIGAGAAPVDTAPILAASAQVKAQRDALAAAVLAGTPSDPTLPPVSP
jgi:hypothetical protein